MPRSLCLFLVLLLTTATAFPQAGATAAASPTTAEQWGIFEASFRGTDAGNPFTDVRFSATFQQGDRSVSVTGFYDGEGIYRVRFMPPSTGVWAYVTHSNRAELDGKSGRFNAASPSAGNHGPVRVADGFHFSYADGTPYFELGTTCYAWAHQPEALQEQTLKTLAASPFDKLRMCVFPKWYIYNHNEPARFAFVRAADGNFDPTRFDPVFWRQFEGRVGDLRRLGIEADLILFHPYDRWGFAQMSPAADDRYLRYAIARLSAYRNVWWSLANEYDLMNKTSADWDRFFGVLQNEDPSHHLRGVHNCREFYDHTKPWVTHASIQRDGDLRAVFGWRGQYQKPVVIDECGYEGNIPDVWGNLSGHEMVRRFWLGTLSGGYVGHGETFKNPHDVLWWSKGGVLHGESPARLAFLRKTMEALPFHRMTPAQPSPDVQVLAKPGAVYLVYALKAGPLHLQLDGKKTYTVESLDTWAMTSERLANAKPGEFTFTAPHDDFLLRITSTSPTKP